MIKLEKKPPVKVEEDKGSGYDDSKDVVVEVLTDEEGNTADGLSVEVRNYNEKGEKICIFRLGGGKTPKKKPAKRLSFREAYEVARIILANIEDDGVEGGDEAAEDDGDPS